MIKHVVMWKVRGPTARERSEQVERIRRALLGLSGKIPGMSSLEVGAGEGGGDDESDVVLITTHDSWDALKSYQAHPEHQAVARLIGELRRERRVVDFEA
jgi:hypothetical protein